MEKSSLSFNPKYDDNKDKNIIYVGKKSCNSNSKNEYRSVSLIMEPDTIYISEKNKDKENKLNELFENKPKIDYNPVEFLIKDKEILYSTSSGQQKICCWLIESTDGKFINGLHLSRRTKKGEYASEEIILNLESVISLKKFLNKLHIIDNKKHESFIIPLSTIEEEDKGVITDEEFNELIRKNIGSIDDFYKLMLVKKMELGIEKLKDIILGNYKNEIDIQKFLKQNLWMFGNEYSVVVEEEKINSKNILDLIPKNLESYIDIIEVKCPDKKLFNYDSSHNNYYSTSDLTKAIAQTQNYIFELEKKMTDERYQKNNNCRIVRPRGIIIYGSDIIMTEEEFMYLRILNSSYHNLKIITYQQLLDKAQNILNFQK